MFKPEDLITLSARSAGAAWGAVLLDRFSIALTLSQPSSAAAAAAEPQAAVAAPAEAAGQGGPHTDAAANSKLARARRDRMA